MRLCNTRSPRSSITKSAGRVLLVFGHLATWAVVPLMAIWPAGDPHPQTSAIFLAVQRGNLAAIDEALGNGLDVDLLDETGITPLMAAARTGRLDAVRKLLAAGASVDACVPVFGTSLMAATMSGHHDVMRELIERGANVDAANPTGQTALWYARMNSDAEAVGILIAVGAVAEGHATHGGNVIEQGAHIGTPSETCAIKTARLAVPALAVESERGQTPVQSAQ